MASGLMIFMSIGAQLILGPANMSRSMRQRVTDRTPFGSTCPAAERKLPTLSPRRLGLLQRCWSAPSPVYEIHLSRDAEMENSYLPDTLLKCLSDRDKRMTFGEIIRGPRFRIYCQTMISVLR